MDDLLDDLGEFGLNGYESAVYLAMLSRNGLTPAELASKAKVPRQRIYDVLESLTGKGLCTNRDTSPKSYFAVDPTLALEFLRRRHIEELAKEQKRTAKKAEDLVQRLAPIFQSARSQNDPLSYIEVLSDASRIAAKVMELARSARVCVNSCMKQPFLITQEQNWGFFRESLSRGLLLRAVCERAAWCNGGLQDWIEAFQDWKPQIRIADEVPLKMQSFDDTAVLLSMQDPVGGLPTFTALAIRHRGMTGFLNMAFERLWEKSEPLDYGKGRP